MTERLDALRSALGELLSREFAPSPGHVTALLNGCAFAPSLLTFWAVNGVLDFSTAFVLGATGGPGGLAVRVLAYLLLVPAFVALRVGYYLAHPRHRETVLAGACPDSRLLSLDWFSVGILATGLPLALRTLGPWLAANAVFLVGLFLLPRVLPERAAIGAKLASVGVGSALFLYASYGRLAADVGLPVPVPTRVLGPVASFELPDATVRFLLAATNSLLVGPVLVAAFALAMSRVLTRPELRDVPGLARALPRRDPAGAVVASAALGTAFYLGVVAATTGYVVLVP